MKLFHMKINGKFRTSVNQNTRGIFFFLIFISMFHVIVNLRCAGERTGERRSKGICLWEVPFVFIAMRDGA